MPGSVGVETQWLSSIRWRPGRRWRPRTPADHVLAAWSDGTDPLLATATLVARPVAGVDRPGLTARG